MSRHFITDVNGRRWMIGYDNPYKGFYAMRYNNEPESEEEFDVTIGFASTVPLDELEIKCAGLGLNVVPYRLRLREDETRESKPLSPLQQTVQAMQTFDDERMRLK